MLEKGKIDSKQAIMLIISMILPTAFITVPAITVKYARQDAWLSIIFATVVGLLTVRMVVILGSRFPGKTLFEYAEEILGKIPGKLVGLLYIWLYFMIITSGVGREYSEFVVMTMLPDTPLIVILIVGFSVVTYMVRNGLEVLSRFNQLTIPSTGLLVIIFLLSTKDMHSARLLPVFDTGLIPIVKGAVTPAMWLGESVTLAMFIPFLNRPQEAGRIATLAILFSSFFLTASILEALLIFGPNLTAAYFFPLFNAVRVVSVANFLERMESIMMVVFVLGGFVKVGIFYYVTVLGSAQWLGLKDYRPLVLPVGVILVALSILLYGGNIVEVLNFIDHLRPLFMIVFQTGIPLLLLIVALARGKGGEGID